jgi:copper(I)-binding protein
MKLNKAFITSTLYAGLFATLSTAAFAGDIKVGDLTIEHPAIRATVPGAKVAGGFMMIKNNGKTADRLVSGSADFTQKVEIHEMKVVDEIMRMRELKEGLEIPAGGSVHLKPGGYHVMFIKLKERMLEGEMRKAELVFEKAGKVTIEFSVQSIAKTMQHGKMDHSKMKMKDGKMKKPSN